MTAPTLLGVWAHPDDEAYLSAGLMATWRRAGGRVVVVTATDGEHGTGDPATWPPARLARHRRAELRASLAALGVDELHLLGHPDGGCEQVDGTSTIASFIDDVRPDVIVTFGPDGVTGHPDHRAVSNWTTAAWSQASVRTDRAIDLWYATFTPEFHDRWGTLNDSVGLWADQPAPPTTDVTDLAHLLELDDELLDRKFAALRAHASQTDPLVERVGAATFRYWWHEEAFRSATGRSHELVALSSMAR